MTSLHEFLDQQEGVEERGFVVDNEQKANWALRKIKQMREQIEKTNSIAESEIQNIEQWSSEENDKCLQSIDYFQSLLAEYAMNLKDKDPKFKSLKLPNGRIGFRKRQPKWTYDDDKVLQALKDAEMDDLIRVRESPKKDDIKKVFEVINGRVVNPNTGEVIEGITVEEQPDNFNVVVDK